MNEQKELSQAEIILETAKALVDHERQLKDHEERLLALEDGLEDATPNHPVRVLKKSNGDIEISINPREVMRRY